MNILEQTNKKPHILRDYLILQIVLFTLFFLFYSNVGILFLFYSPVQIAFSFYCYRYFNFYRIHSRLDPPPYTPTKGRILVLSGFTLNSIFIPITLYELTTYLISSIPIQDGIIFYLCTSLFDTFFILLFSVLFRKTNAIAQKTDMSQKEGVE
ncbi:hypothetical protein MsAc7_14140 [Methanolapillus millepedarum]|uniref:Uncharacterized protein n=1 Tax=Methanolapillus millepedarum TaxID=3028296 RepID=A0AA96ZUK4_9EURY|nr:hypothetical protein MsAc7_14140 [Methanosarcinaceae archaeon Ac7]